MKIISPDLKRAGLRPARAGGREGQPGGGNWPRRPGSVIRPPPTRGVGIASRGCGPPWGVAPSLRGGDTAPDTGLQQKIFMFVMLLRVVETKF